MNNTKLEGQKDPFYYAGEGYEFLPGECYYLELTRKDDGVVTRTCEICPGGITPIDDIYLLEPYVVNTLVGSGLPIYIENIPGAIVNLYSATGQLIESMQVTSQNVEIKAPMKEGVYLLQVVTSAETFVTKIIVITK